MLALYLLAAKDAAQPGSSRDFFISFLIVYGLALLALCVLIGIGSIAVKMILAFLRTEEKQACPGCGSNHVRLSQSHGGPMDGLASILGCVPLRCRACRHRYYARRVRGSSADPKLAAE